MQGAGDGAAHEPEVESREDYADHVRDVQRHALLPVEHRRPRALRRWQNYGAVPGHRSRHHPRRARLRGHPPSSRHHAPGPRGCLRGRLYAQAALGTGLRLHHREREGVGEGHEGEAELRREGLRPGDADGRRELVPREELRASGRQCNHLGQRQVQGAGVALPAVLDWHGSRWCWLDGLQLHHEGRRGHSKGAVWQHCHPGRLDHV
mmetsp:Transcript_108103/g.316043  ORF Transcript_108103/g.316043 Transcript_108103/m.316043 type:complete len:207 (+) Transcript_108103:500-1120(+)